MKIHEVKTWPHLFYNTSIGIKTADFRKNDREYKVGDLLIQREYDPTNDADHKYSGLVIAHKITHIQTGFGIPDGYVMLSLQKI